MGTRTIHFLAAGENYNEAEEKVCNYVECENFYEAYWVSDKESRAYAMYKSNIEQMHKDWDWQGKAENYLKQAEEQKQKGQMVSYGYCLQYAGILFAQDLAYDTWIYNIDNSDYSLPVKPEGWWVIAVDFHI